MKIPVLKGTRDYLPEEQELRETIIEILKKNFRRYGYKPVETSILDFYEFASSKAGNEIVSEIYRLRDRGNRDLCLRYELTFKLAKLIGLNPNLRMPFKRYEIGKVFRDGPVSSIRMREFVQCDVDCVGSESLAVDAELLALTFDIFKELGLEVYVELNSRKFLSGLMEECGIEKDKIDSAILSIDKLEKYGKQSIINELKAKGLRDESIKKLFAFFDKARSEREKNNEKKLEFFKRNLRNSLAIEGLKEIEELLRLCKVLGLKDVIFVPSLARGLAYYTGPIWEVYLKNSKQKRSIAAGGRWDNLISKMLNTSRAYPASGMSFGLDVIYEVLKEKKIKLEKIKKMPVPKVLIIPINTLEKCLKIAQSLRASGINTDISDKQLSKALDYANKEGIEFCLIIGENELKSGKLRLRNMINGKEELLNEREVIEKLVK
ncbi:MAG: histidine--tRNA ligase [Candidatus Pacearchaeota archaeon]